MNIKADKLIIWRLWYCAALILSIVLRIQVSTALVVDCKTFATPQFGTIDNDTQITIENISQPMKEKRSEEELLRKD